MSAQPVPTRAEHHAEIRAEKIRDLRALLDVLEAHPDVPIDGPGVEFCVLGSDDEAGVAEVARIAASLGVEIGGSPGGRYLARLRVGRAEYEAFYCSRDQMARHAAYTSYAGAVEPAGGIQL